MSYPCRISKSLVAELIVVLDISICQLKRFTVSNGDETCVPSFLSSLSSRLIIFRQPYVQMLFVLYLVTVMSRRESYWLLSVPELAQLDPYTIYVVSFLALPKEYRRNRRLEAKNSKKNFFCISIGNWPYSYLWFSTLELLDHLVEWQYPMAIAFVIGMSENVKRIH